MKQFKKLNIIWLVILALLTIMVPAYGYNNEGNKKGRFKYRRCSILPRI